MAPIQPPAPSPAAQITLLTARRDALVQRILAHPTASGTPQQRPAADEATTTGTSGPGPSSCSSPATTVPGDSTAMTVTAPSGGQDDDEEGRIARALALARASRAEQTALLGRYNEVKDVAQGLMGMIAEQRGCRVRDVMGELGVGVED